MYQLQCKTCKTRTGLNLSFRYPRTYAAHMALYHPPDKQINPDPINPDPINPDPINPDRIKELTDEIENLKLKNIELKKNVIVDVTKLRYQEYY